MRLCRTSVFEAIFGATFKVFSADSAGRFMRDMADAIGKEFVSKVPHFNTVLKHLEDPEITLILPALIERSSLPMKPIETDFAVDSTGFMSSRFCSLDR